MKIVLSLHAHESQHNFIVELYAKYPIQNSVDLFSLFKQINNINYEYNT